jgi:hypothetical protein
MRATTPSAHKPVNQVTAGVQASIHNSLRENAAEHPLLTLALLALAVAVVAAIVAVAAAGFVLAQGLIKIARMVPVRAIWQKAGTAAAAVLLWAMTHKRQLVVALLVLNAPGIILELLKLIK